MKMLFLDFDGVLNSDKWFTLPEYHRGPLHDSWRHLHHIDPAGVARVNTIVDKSGAVVIASTAWRVVYQVDQLNSMLKLKGATFEIVDRTPEIVPKKMSSYVPRGKEIQKFFDSIGGPPDEFVILDDLNDMLHLTPHLVRTNDYVGLTDADVEKALKILKVE